MPKIMKGMKDARIFPITTNDADEFKAGILMRLPGAQSLEYEPEVEEWKVYADDGVYDSGSDFKGVKVTLQIADISLDAFAQLKGCVYNSSDDTLDFKSSDMAPEIGLTFACQLSNNTYRLFKFYAGKVDNIKMSAQTRGEGSNENAVTIEMTASGRKIDNKYLQLKDVDTIEDGQVWLTSLDDTP